VSTRTWGYAHISYPSSRFGLPWSAQSAGKRSRGLRCCRLDRIRYGRASGDASFASSPLRDCPALNLGRNCRAAIPKQQRFDLIRQHRREIFNAHLARSLPSATQATPARLRGASRLVARLAEALVGHLAGGPECLLRNHKPARSRAWSAASRGGARKVRGLAKRRDRAIPRSFCPLQARACAVWSRTMRPALMQSHRRKTNEWRDYLERIPNRCCQ
jgi:hypothetical protein